MTSSMKSDTVVTTVSLSPNPIQTNEAFLVDVVARSRSKWGDYSADSWQSVSRLIWG